MILEREIYIFVLQTACSRTLQTLELGFARLPEKCSRMLSKSIEYNSVLMKWQISTLDEDASNLLWLFTSTCSLTTPKLGIYDMVPAECFSLFRFLRNNDRLLNVSMYPYRMNDLRYEYEENFLNWACIAAEKFGCI